MKQAYYGRISQTQVVDDAARHAEEVTLKGFSIVENVLTLDQLRNWRAKIDEVYQRQEDDFGRDALIEIQELDVCRAPLIHDFSFIELAALPRLLSIVELLLGDWFILNLQNAVINRPSTDHHQGSWHRDLPHQNFVISRPLAVNALLALDDFSAETGGTRLLPYSHRAEILPSDEYIEQNGFISQVSAGSAIVFDSMLFHRAGANTSSIVRRSVNHMYTVPIMKQQYDFPLALANVVGDDAFLRQLLGFTCQVPRDDKAWRTARQERLINRK